MNIEGLQIFENRGHHDNRGEFYCSLILPNKRIGNGVSFREWDFSYNFYNVLRGMHCDYITWKLVECVYGEIFWAGYDIRPSSKTFRKSINVIISRSNHKQILIPPGVLSGFYVRSKEAVFYYRQSEIYENSSNQVSVKWNDPALGIRWPSKDPIVSKRDCNASLLKDII